MKTIGRFLVYAFWAVVMSMVYCFRFGIRDGSRIWWNAQPPTCRFCLTHVDCKYIRCHADSHSHQDCVIQYAEKREVS